jgi:hypothetical protein
MVLGELVLISETFDLLRRPLNRLFGAGDIRGEEKRPDTTRKENAIRALTI